MTDLIVEDGTGLPDADAFVDEDFCDTYCEDREINDWFEGDGDGKAAIRIATSILSNAYSWKGFKLRGRLQSQAHPRIDLTDGEGDLVDPSSVAQEVLYACCELAAYVRANPGTLTPAVVQTERLKSEQIGPIKVEYLNASNQITDVRPILLHVDDLISGLLDAGSRSGLIGTVARI